MCLDSGALKLLSSSSNFSSRLLKLGAKESLSIQIYDTRVSFMHVYSLDVLDIFGVTQHKNESEIILLCF